MGLIRHELSYGICSGVDDFISGHPVLLDAGRMCDYSYASECDGWHQRSAIGYTKSGDVILLAVDKPGMTLRGLRQMMYHLGAYSAINLDGGGSTSLYSYGKCINKQTDQRAVNNVIMIRLKEAV
jgi:exopolysaccharide biosynthesis protein